MESFLSWCRANAADIHKDLPTPELLNVMTPFYQTWLEDEKLVLCGHEYPADVSHWKSDIVDAVYHDTPYRIFYEETFGCHTVLYNNDTLIAAMMNSTPNNPPRLYELGKDGIELEQPYFSTTYLSMFRNSRRTRIDVSNWDFSEIVCLDNCFMNDIVREVNLGPITKERFPMLKTAKDVFGEKVANREEMQRQLDALCC